MRKTKRLIPAMLALAMILMFGAPALAALGDTGYADVDASAWYADAAKELRDKGLMLGMGTDTFSPDSPYTRAQLAMVLYRMAGSPDVTGEDTFPDTNPDAWYAKAVLWAQRENVINGVENGLYAPDRATTQEMLVTMLWRDAGEPDAAAASDASAWAAEAVGWARETGLIRDDANYTFAPKSGATRAQIAVIVSRYLAAATLSADVKDENGKTLIVYFTPANSDGVDAVSSATPRVGDTASVEYVAQMIHEQVDADVAKIVPKNAYPLAYRDAADQARAEQADNVRPEFTLEVNPEDYDVIFAGYPIWYYHLPMIMQSFFDTYDFSGKTIIPFNNHAGSRDGGTYRDIAELEPGATVLEGLPTAGESAGAAEASVKSWLSGLGY